MVYPGGGVISVSDVKRFCDKFISNLIYLSFLSEIIYYKTLHTLYVVYIWSVEELSLVTLLWYKTKDFEHENIPLKLMWMCEQPLSKRQVNMVKYAHTALRGGMAPRWGQVGPTP